MTMHKTIVLILILLCSLNILAQKKQEEYQIPRIENTGKYGFEKVIEIDNKSAKQLFDHIKSYLIKKHADNDFIIANEAKELFDHGSFPATFKVTNIQITYTILYTLSIKFKDNKFKLVLSDMKASTNSQGTTSEVPLENHFENMNALATGKKYAREMNESLSESIINGANKLFVDIENSFAEKDEW